MEVTGTVKYQGFSTGLAELNQNDLGIQYAWFYSNMHQKASTGLASLFCKSVKLEAGDPITGFIRPNDPLAIAAAGNPDRCARLDYFETQKIVTQEPSA